VVSQFERELLFCLCVLLPMLTDGPACAVVGAAGNAPGDTRTLMVASASGEPHARVVSALLVLMSGVVRCFAGALAGLVGITVVYPLDYSRVRLANDMRNYRGRSIHCSSTPASFSILLRLGSAPLRASAVHWRGGRRAADLCTRAARLVLATFLLRSDRSSKHAVLFVCFRRPVSWVRRVRRRRCRVSRLPVWLVRLSAGD
jgi:hypothetical protein